MAPYMDALGELPSGSDSDGDEEETPAEPPTTKGNNTIFVPSGPGAVADAAASVRMGMMQGAIGADAVRR